MRVAVAGEQQDLEDHQARGPHRRGAPEPGEHEFGQQELDLEQQARAQRDGGPEQRGVHGITDRRRRQGGPMRASRS
jgi:hypothetical protein